MLWRSTMTTRDEAIDIAVDDQRIAGTLVTPDTLIPGVLFVHGWGGSQQHYLARGRQIAALGCVCLTFNLRGHGETEPQHDTVTREDNLRDLVAAYEVLASQRMVDKAYRRGGQQLRGVSRRSPDRAAAGALARAARPSPLQG